MDKRNSIYFADGKKTIDFVLVYRKSSLASEPLKLKKLDTFTSNLGKLGLFLESEPFESDSDVIFVKIHAADDSVDLYSDLCNVNLASRTMAYRPTTKPPPHFLATPLTRPDPEDPTYRRAPESVGAAIPKNITSAERILVVHKLMVRVKYGDEENEYGIDQMLEENLIFDYFPIHEGHCAWTDTGPLLDRQLLSKYWATYKMWNKMQPLHLVERYYGPEYAFYFAWIDHYIKMLILPALLSLVVLVYGIATLNTIENIRSKEICDSKLIMCPRCHFSKCKFEFLRSTCTMAKISHMFDNTASYVYAIFISIWSTVFTELWQRKQAVLQLQWNLKQVEHDTVTRPEYLKRAKKYKYSPVTDNEEPYIPVVDKCLWFTITFVVVLLVFFMIIGAVIGVMVYQITINFILLQGKQKEIITKNRRMIASISGSFMSAAFIISLKQIFKKISLWLTKLENHTTQYDFDNAYIYKNYGFAFVNNYASSMYIAFFKGRFFTYPGDLKQWEEFGGLGSDICDTSGCIMDLCIQLIVILFVKAIISNISQYINPIVQSHMMRILKHVHGYAQLPFYQQEYIKPKTKHFFLVDEYLEMIIQYGFVILFVAAFPLAPLLAFVGCVGELRTDASKLTRNYRRPIPQRVAGLGAWFSILQAVTYIGVVTNAVVIAFTSNAVDFQVYRFSLTDTHGGFHNTTISAFDISEFEIVRERFTDQKWCYYPGRRYPPDHPLKYQRTKDFWFILCLRFLVVVVFESFKSESEKYGTVYRGWVLRDEYSNLFEQVSKLVVAIAFTCEAFIGINRPQFESIAGQINFQRIIWFSLDLMEGKTQYALPDSMSSDRHAVLIVPPGQEIVHIIIAVKGVLAYAIPDIPKDVQEQIEREKLKEQESTSYV